MSPAEYRTIRERIGTQAQVAAMLEIDRQTISNRERGLPRSPITKEAALALRQLEASKEDTTP